MQRALVLLSLSSQGGVLEAHGPFNALKMFSGSRLLASLAGPVFRGAPFQAILIADGSVVEGGNGGSVEIDGTLFLSTASGSLEDDAIVGPGSGFAAFDSYYIGSMPSTYGFTQSGLASWNATLACQVALLRYEPAEPANWPLPTPTTVQEGLDALAARLGPP